MKNEGYVVPKIERYLMSLNADDNNRAINVNAPSSAGVSCLRQRYYSRTKTESDSNSIEPRLHRIFDNGHGVHARLQEYLLEQGMLLMDEVPVLNIEYNIQGHTDGILKLSPAERAILEIKSMNSNGFSSLKDAREDHKYQGLVYLYCLEKRRQDLQESYATEAEFNDDFSRRNKILRERYQHLKAGKKYTRNEKISFQLSLHAKADSILYNTKLPIKKVIFLYENKDTQDLKEYAVSIEKVENRLILQTVLDECATLNEYVKNKELPPRCEDCTSKSSSSCRWCSFKSQCFG